MTLQWKFFNQDMETGKKMSGRTEIYLNEQLIIVHELEKSKRYPLDVRIQKTKRAVEVLESFVGSLIDFYHNDHFEFSDELLKVHYIEKDLPKEKLINFSIETPSSYTGRIEPSVYMKAYLERHHLSLAEFRSENEKRGFFRPYHDKYGNLLDMADNKINYKFEKAINLEACRYLTKELEGELLEIRDLYVQGKYNKAVSLLDSFKSKTYTISFNRDSSRTIVDNGKAL